MSYDPERAIFELKTLQPHLADKKLGGVYAFHYQRIIPAHTFDFLVLPRPQDLLVIKARSSFNLELAVKIVEFCETKHAGSNGLMVHEGFACPGFTFECVTFAGPMISRCFKGESAYLAEHATWVFPTHHCEFRTDPEGTDFGFLTGKGARIEIMDWNRKPTPQARVRLLTDCRGGMLAKRKKLGIVEWKSLIHIASNLPSPEKILVANIKDEELEISSTQEGFFCSGAISREGLTAADLTAILGPFLLCQSPTG